MTPNLVKTDATPKTSLSRILEELHSQGPSTQRLLQTISLYSEFHPEEFKSFEQDILAAMGLFYKLEEPESLYAFLISRMGEANKVAGGEILTPVQASLVSAIRDNQLVSISAPTSAGKSYSIRDFISQSDGDAAIIVPSRALIAEYVSTLRSYFAANKGVMVMPFVDVVYKSRALRRILVLTPERAREVLDRGQGLDLRVFFFDEAQVSEEGMRGVVFDQLVRRVRKNYPSAKLIFAHPFVSNPDAQFRKHGFPDEISFSKAYEQGAVGKLFVQRHSNGRDYYFSPFEEKGASLKSCVEFGGEFSKFALRGAKSILVYVTKMSIYNGSFKDDFDKYISNLPLIRDRAASLIIGEIKRLIGADQVNHRSTMIDLLRKGVVIHHGSVPLEVRFLLEEFIRQKFAKICFATSTLAQGINMPFDIVWLNSMRIHAESEEERSLALKNLIGRAGRLSPHEIFDYGYVYTKNPALLSRHLSEEYELSERSLIDSMTGERANEDMEVVEAIRGDNFNEDLHIPESRVERLSGSLSQEAMRTVLSLIYAEGLDPSKSLRGGDNRPARVQLEASLRLIYEAYLGRELLPGEQAVFTEAIFVMIQSFAGRTFREVVGMRYSSISRRDERDKPYAAFSQPASSLPDVKLSKIFSLYKNGTPKESVSYDVVMFDTYDYIDKVMSFCLFDVFNAAAKLYYAQNGDARALKFMELLRFGTNDPVKILLMRYGFLPDQVESLLPHLSKINEDEIVFKATIKSVSPELRNVVEWYL